MAIEHDRNRSTWGRKYGINLDVDGAEDIIAAGGDQHWPASVVAAADIDIVSDQAADAIAGTGGQKIWVQGLGANLKLQSEEIDLAGLTDVHPTLDYFRLFRAKITDSGSGGENAGNILIDINGTNTLAYIPAGYGQTQQAAFTIPKDWKFGWIRKFIVKMVGSSTPATDTAQGLLMARDAPDQSWRVLENWSISRDKSCSMQTPATWPGIKLPAGADVKLRVTDVSSTNSIISGTIFTELEG